MLLHHGRTGIPDAFKQERIRQITEHLASFGFFVFSLGSNAGGMEAFAANFESALPVLKEFVQLLIEGGELQYDVGVADLRVAFVGQSRAGSGAAVAAGRVEDESVTASVSLGGTTDLVGVDSISGRSGVAHLAVTGSHDTEIRAKVSLELFEKLSGFGTKLFLVVLGASHEAFGPSMQVSWDPGNYYEFTKDEEAGGFLTDAWLVAFLAWRLGGDGSYYRRAVFERMDAVYSFGDGFAVVPGEAIPPLLEVEAGPVFGPGSGVQITSTPFPLGEPFTPAITLTAVGPMNLPPVVGSNSMPIRTCLGDPQPGQRQPTNGYIGGQGFRVDWDHPAFGAEEGAILRFPLALNLETIVDVEGIPLPLVRIGVDAGLITRGDLNLVNQTATGGLSPWRPRVGLGSASGPSAWTELAPAPDAMSYPCGIIAQQQMATSESDIRDTWMSTLLAPLAGAYGGELSAQSHLFLDFSTPSHRRGSAILRRISVFAPP